MIISEEEELIKIVISGPQKSGKTSLIGEKPTNPYSMTIGI